ncbi:MAG: response regulator, partial [Lentisphaerota bacterium]
GIGIPANIIDHIFEPFFTTKGQDKGTGLGLSVVYGIIKQHHGFVTVSSEPGQGATFHLYLPECLDVVKDDEVKGLIPEAYRGRGERILLVEDEQGLRSLCVRMLRENGYVPLEAESAEKALQILEQEQNHFDLLFTDLVLPDSDGLKLVEQVRQRVPDMAVLITSGYHDDRAHGKDLTAQKIPLLHKPYDMKALYRLVREILDEKKGKVRSQGKSA